MSKEAPRLERRKAGYVMQWCGHEISFPTTDERRAATLRDEFLARQLSVSQVARRLGVSSNRVRQRIRRGQIRVHVERSASSIAGERWWIPEAELTGFLERAETDPAVRLRRYPTRRRKPGPRAVVPATEDGATETAIPTYRNEAF